MSLGQGARPIETKDGEKIDVDAESGRNALATSDRSVTEILEELLVEARKIRRGFELIIEQEIDDVDR